MARRKYDPKKLPIALGKKVERLRLARGWTLEECEAHGWNEWTHLSRIESGKNITLETLAKLANLFGMHPSDLLKDL